MASLEMSTPGLRRYFYEYLFYRANEMAVPWSNRTLEANGQKPMEPLSVSASRGIRAELDRVLAEQNLSMEDPSQIDLPTLFGAMDEAFDRSIPGRYTRQFTKIMQSGRVKDSKAYNALFSTFNSYIGNTAEVPAGGERLPISPYDPRWAYRDTVQNRGPELLAMNMQDVIGILEADAGSDAPRGVNRLDAPPMMISKYVSPQLQSNTAVTGGTGDYLPDVGQAYTENDAMGLGVLRNYMTEAEYSAAAPWVLQGVSENGSVDPRKAMSDEALARSVAVLDYLSDNGIDYSIAPDLMPGQLRVRIDGGVDVRLTETRDHEAWVGRVYNNGAWVSYSRGGASAEDNAPVVPTPAQTVDLVRFARGEAVERTDGAGMVGDVSNNGSGARDTFYTTTGKVLTSKVDDGLFIRIDARRRTSTASWYNPEDPEKATTFLSNAVSSAREAMVAGVNLTGEGSLVDEFIEHAEDPDFVPDFAGTTDVAGLRQAYWNALRSGEVSLLVPGYSAADEREALDNGDFEALEAMSLSNTAQYAEALDAVRQRYAEEGVPDNAPDAETVAALQAHLELAVDETVGTFEPDANGVRFDPVKVSTMMESDSSVWRNNDEIVAALRSLDIPAEQLRGDNFYNGVVADRLIKFNEDTAVDMRSHDHELIRTLAGRVEQAVETHGATLRDVQIDDQGIVRWSAERTMGKWASANREPSIVTGEMGQILAPGEHGEIVTKLGSGNDYLFVPGYEASVIPQKAGENLSLEQRTRLRGYEQVLSDAIGTNVADGLLANRSMVGEPTNLNSAVRRLYSTRHAPDFMERSLEEGMSEADRDALLATEALRVRYSNEMGAGATTLPVMKAERDLERQGLDHTSWQRNDNGRDPLKLTGGRNMSVLDVEHGAGYFDPVMTAVGRNQGIVRYLVPDAQVNQDGSITPGSEDGRVPVATSEMAWAMEYDPHDRQNMSLSNIMQASSIAGGVRTSMMQFGGWNFEDGIIVSQSFAAEHGLRGTDGTMRDLVVGDKLSDYHGNKGVISLVVDPTMDEVAAEEAGLSEQVQFFRDNPDVEVVMSPFSAISRFNGGTAREMMQDPSDVIVRNEEGGREVVTGGAGGLNMIVTHMAVDAKTNIYDAEAVSEGRGRKASSQLAWALQAKGCDEIMRDFYGSNTSGVTNAREYLIALGMDMTPTGELRSEYDSMEYENRKVFDMPEVIAGSNKRMAVANFGREISNAGGFLELPFPLNFPSGNEGDPRSTPGAREGVWRLPVLASHLRSEQDLDDGSVSRHDHTVRYMKIYEAAYDYLKVDADIELARENLQTAQNEAREAGRDVESDTAVIKAQKKLRAKEATRDKDRASAKRTAQTNYDMVSKDIISRRIEGKHNVFRDGLMNNRRPYSATAVWSGDPRLNVDQVAMNSAMAAELGVAVDAAKADAGDKDADTKGRYVMVWRDPVLRDGAVRYLEVVIDDNLTGVAVNPVSVKSMDGDFDGDSVGLVGNLSDKAHTEAMETLTVEANLLDKGVAEIQPDGSVRHPLALHDALDTKVAQYADPALKEQMSDIVEQLNRVEADTSLPRDERTVINRAYMEDLNEIYRQGFASTKDRVRLQFDNIDNHMASVAKCYETGAKGSEKKLNDYAEYLAVSKGDDGRYVDLGHQDRETMVDKHIGSQKATSFKSELTGVAGARSQAAVQLFRVAGELKVATEITYPVTQAMLQAKHDPVDAAYRAKTIDGPLRDLWKGRAMSASVIDGRYEWKVLTDEKGEPIQATTQQFVDQMEKMIVHDEGMGVPLNKQYVARAAELLDDGSGHIIDTDRKNWDELSADQRPLTLDVLAYNGTLDDVLKAAEARESLFTGANAQFAPTVVRRNIAAEEAALLNPEKEIVAEAVAAKDTAADYTPKVAPTPLVGKSVRRTVAPQEPLVAPQSSPSRFDPEPVYSARTSAADGMSM